MTASELTELAARVEAGQGEDRELDADVASALSWITRAPPGGELSGFPPRWTSSLDAVVALIAERLPEAFWDLDSSGDCRLWPAGIGDEFSEQVDGEPKANERARGLLACALRALAAQQQDRPTEGDKGNG